MSDDQAGAFRATYAELYDRHLVPLLFAPYGRVLADRAKALRPRSVLETAAGTGALTRRLAQTLGREVRITATDLNAPMIERAKIKPEMAEASINWRQADAMTLPFPDESFDLVVCQFGVMFFPDKEASFRETSRVLQGGGIYLFTVWDDWNKMEDAPLRIAADVVGEMLGCGPQPLVNPPYYNEGTIRSDLSAANFQRIDIYRARQPVNAASPRDAAVATVHGSLIRTVLEATAPERLQEATDAVERALRTKFGDTEIAGTTTALVISAEKPPVS